MSIVKSLRGQLAPIHPEGYMFVAGFAVATLILWWIWAPLGWLGLIATLWCAYFFRDPTRVTPVRERPRHCARRRRDQFRRLRRASA